MAINDANTPPDIAEPAKVVGRRYRHRLLITSLFVLQLMACGGIGIYVLNNGRPLFAPSPEKLRQLGEPLAASLNRYQADHGRYPVSLEQAGIEDIDPPYGGFNYDVSESGTEARLWIGDYGEYLFEVSWDSETG